MVALKNRNTAVVGVLVLIAALFGSLALSPTAVGKGRTNIAQGGGTGDNYTFGFNLSQTSDGNYSASITYVESHGAIPGGPDGSFTLMGSGVQAIDVTHLPGSFAYFEAILWDQPGFHPWYICVWATDGIPDRFGLSDPHVFSSGPDAGVCIPGTQSGPPPAPAGGPGLNHGNVTVR